jgi:hypothetical protein
VAENAIRVESHAEKKREIASQRGGGCHGGRPREQEALRPWPRVGHRAPAPRPPLRVLTLRLLSLFRFRGSTLPRLCAPALRSHASSSAPAALRSTPSAAPSSKSEVVLLSATSPPQVRRVPARTPGQRHRRVLPVPGRPPRRGAAAVRERGGVLPWVRDEGRGGKAPQQASNRSVGLPLLSLGEAIEDRSGTGSPP